MESQIKWYMRFKVELESLDRMMESNLERIIQAIERIKKLNNNIKTTYYEAVLYSCSTNRYDIRYL